MTTPIAAGLRPGTYLVDAGRSSVRFTATHVFGLGPVAGTFAVRDGTIRIDDKPDRCAVSATVDSASFRTDKPKRDADIIANFLHSDRYPDLAFRSTGVDGGRLHGTMTVHGRTAPVRFELAQAEPVDGGCRFLATARVDRYAFGVTRGRGIVGRYVDVTVEVFAVPDQ
jgi:polyisoprenoid-binding protein YceI